MINISYNFKSTYLFIFYSKGAPWDTPKPTTPKPTTTTTTPKPTTTTTIPKPNTTTSNTPTDTPVLCSAPNFDALSLGNNCYKHNEINMHCLSIFFGTKALFFAFDVYNNMRDKLIEMHKNQCYFIYMCTSDISDSFLEYRNIYFSKYM